MRGETDLADERFAMSVTRAPSSETGCISRRPIAQLEAGLMLGRYAETERVAREGIEQLREMGERGYLSTSLIYLADAIVSQDRPDEAETTLKEAEEQAAEDDAVAVIGIHRVRAKILRGRDAWTTPSGTRGRRSRQGNRPTTSMRRAAHIRSWGRSWSLKEERDEGLGSFGSRWISSNARVSSSA